jgi:hypothetical protein
MPQLAGYFIAHILPDDVRLLPVVEDPERLLLEFRYLLATARWLAAAKDDPPIGAALDITTTSPLKEAQLRPLAVPSTHLS